jgi:cytochrome c oxidase subunit 3
VPTPEKAEYPAAVSALKEQFMDLGQQREADLLGMWVFLATEVLFFGGLFMAYIVYRWRFPMAFDEASNHLHVALGTINTLVLLFSSFTMALAVHCAQLGRRTLLAVLLLLTALLGAGFLAIKFFEWHLEAVDALLPGARFSYFGPHHNAAQLFFWLYFGMTGLHALHLSIGVLIVLVVAARALRGAYPVEHHTTVEVVGLYWHYVDIVWLFLYPLLYLGGRHLLDLWH